MIPATDDDIYFPNLTLRAAYRLTNTIKRKRMTERINLWALGQLFYLYLDGDN